MIEKISLITELIHFQCTTILYLRCVWLHSLNWSDHAAERHRNLTSIPSGIHPQNKVALPSPPLPREKRNRCRTWWKLWTTITTKKWPHAEKHITWFMRLLYERKRIYSPSTEKKRITNPIPTIEADTDPQEPQHSRRTGHRNVNTPTEGIC